MDSIKKHYGEKEERDPPGLTARYTHLVPLRRYSDLLVPDRRRWSSSSVVPDIRGSPGGLL